MPAASPIMNCESLSERIDALVDGELSPDEAGDALRHIDRCPLCARLLGQAEEVKRLLSAPHPDDLETPRALDGLGARVRALATRPHARRSRGLAVALAAGLVAIVSIPAALFWGLDSRSGPGAEIRGLEKEGTPPAMGAAPDSIENREAALELNRQAQSLAEAGRSQEAIALYERLVREFPASPLAPRAEISIARLVSDADPDRGVKRLLDFAESRPASDLADDALFLAAEVEDSRGRLARAVEILRRLLDRHSSGDQAPRAATLLGRTHEKLGNREAALEAYRTAFESYPGTGPGEEARARYEELEMR